MKVSLNWIKEFTTIELGIDELVEKIGRQLGAVEEVESIGEKYQDIIVVKIVGCESHPNADKLKVCKIDDGNVTRDVNRDGQGLIEVVCGAPNARAGMLAAWLPPGATVPATLGKDAPLRLEARDFRGVVSNGMLASAAELAISDDHSGIIEVELKVAPGTKLAEAYKLDDYIIDIENKMFTHRPDLFGELGIAREIAGITHQAFSSPDWYKRQPTSLTLPAEKLPLAVKNELPELVPRFMAVAISGVTVRPSDVWLQSLLSRVGIRPINNIVDITNYMMILTGQPLHAYDYDKVKAMDPAAKAATLVVRHPSKDEKLNLLNGKALVTQPTDIVISSVSQLLGLAGVMGGSDTEVDAQTKNIILECATFDMYTIRKTAMAHGLFTDAVTRFIKGQSPLQNDRVILHAVQKVLDSVGPVGTLASKLIDDNHADSEPRTVVVATDFINARLGLALKGEDMAMLLSNVEFEVQLSGDKLTVTVPFWRTDIEIKEDVVEEIGRLHGYDHLPHDLPQRSIKPTEKDAFLASKARIRELLQRAGANEVLTYSFVHGGLMDKVGQNKDNAFELGNALSPELQYYRQSLTPSLLDKVYANLRGGYDEFALFELNPVHAKDLTDKDDKLPIEDQRLALVLAVSDKTAQAKYHGAPYYAAKHYLEYLLKSLGITDLRFEPTADYEPTLEISKAAIAPFDKARTVIVKTADGQFIGELGEFKASVRRSLKLPPFSAGFELDSIQLMNLMAKQPKYHPLPRFPKVEQDITLKVGRQLPYLELYNFLQSELERTKPDNTWAELVPLDLYQPENEAAQHISWRLTIASYERTLTTETINTLLNDIAAAAKQQFGADRL